MGIALIRIKIELGKLIKLVNTTACSGRRRGITDGPGSSVWTRLHVYVCVRAKERERETESVYVLPVGDE